MAKRVSHVYERLIDNYNISKAVLEVCKTHKYTSSHKINPDTLWIMQNFEQVVADVTAAIEGGYIQQRPFIRRRWDKSAGKWRDIAEPKLYPDQIIHHAVVQVLRPIFMRGMDKFCCGSVPDRGIHYGASAIKRWMHNDVKGTRYAGEFDIHHFYDSITTDVMMARLRELIKDRRMLDVCEGLLHSGVMIGAYFSQWFANTLLQPLDQLIRQSGLCDHYIRYMDNITVFGANKRKLHKLRELIADWLTAHGLELKDVWQIYPTDSRPVTALGYRFYHDATEQRKRNYDRIKRQLLFLKRLKRQKRPIGIFTSQSLMSRLAQLRHCAHVVFFRRYLIAKLQREAKRIIADWQRSMAAFWNADNPINQLIRAWDERLCPAE